MISIYCQSVRHSAPDTDGARLTVIGEAETRILETSSASEAVTTLQSLPIGISVAVRHSKGIRSCMNKPTLWADVLTYC